MKKPCFDKLGPWYQFLESISFGNQLQQCRISQLTELKKVKSVLILGDGNGRFLESFIKTNRNANIETLDISKKMLALAKNRIALIPYSPPIVFIQSDVFNWDFPSNKYDLIVANFFLDCFTFPELTNLVEKISHGLKPGAMFIIGDFNVPKSFFGKLATYPLLFGMYLFFKVFTHISANSLNDSSSLLITKGFKLKNEKVQLCSFIKSQLWIKT